MKSLTGQERNWVLYEAPVQAMGFLRYCSFSDTSCSKKQTDVRVSDIIIKFLKKNKKVLNFLTNQS